MTEKNEKPNSGHEWDGITEYDNPDPKWLRVIFYITLFITLIYWLLFPSWPTPNDTGILEWSSEKQLKEELDSLYKIRHEYQASFDEAPFDIILQDQKLLNFAIKSGRSIFQNNCAVCHGAGGGGILGYPNLTAGAWMWGGAIDDIQHTITHGIRNIDPDSHDSQMPAFGKDQLLPIEDIKLIANYVIYIAKEDKTQYNKSFDMEKAETIFQVNCASCHGADAKGNIIVGAPNLTDAIWLYGGDYNTVYDVIFNGRGGQMPFWNGKLSESEIKAVSVYVHQLGGGR